LVNVKVKSDDPCLMMYTGGTTGPPKGAVLTHSNVVCHMKQMRTWTGLIILVSILSPLPFPFFIKRETFSPFGHRLWELGGNSTDQPQGFKIHVQGHEEIEDHRPDNVPTLYLEFDEDAGIRLWTSLAISSSSAALPHFLRKASLILRKSSPGQGDGGLRHDGNDPPYYR